MTTKAEDLREAASLLLTWAGKVDRLRAYAAEIRPFDNGRCEGEYIADELLEILDGDVDPSTADAVTATFSTPSSVVLPLAPADVSARIAEAQQETASLVLRKAYDALGARGAYPNDQWDSILRDIAHELGVQF